MCLVVLKLKCTVNKMNKRKGSTMANYIYARVSTEGQDIKAQVSELKDYALSNMMKVEEVFSYVISSGESLEKRGVTTLKNRVEEGDTILFTEVSRLGRSLVDTMQFIQELTDNGVRLIFTRQNIDTKYEELDHTAFILLTNLTMMAEVEKRFLVQRTKATLKKKKEQGVKVGRPANPKGTFSKSKFDKHRHDIQLLLNAGKSVREVSTMLGYQNHTGIQNYIKSRGIKKEA